jgi:hypothetical protein
MFGWGNPGFSLVNLSFGALYKTCIFAGSAFPTSAGTLTGSPSGYPASPKKMGEWGKELSFPTLDSG